VVEVFGDFSESLEAGTLGAAAPRERPPPPSDPDILRIVLRDKLALWSKDYVIMLLSQFYARFLNRGVRYRLWRDRLRVWAVSRFIAKHYVREGTKRCNVAFLTFTYDRSGLSLPEAWEDVRRRFRKAVRFFKRRYGLKAAVATVEVHEEGFYPHLHVVLLLETPARTFRHFSKKEKKWVLRFVDKKSNLARYSKKKSRKKSWEEVLGKEGFLDARAPWSARQVAKYLSKYLAKAERELKAGGDLLERPKALAPFLCRLYRVPLVYVYPRGFDKKLLGLTKPQKPVPRPPEEVLLAEAIWAVIYRRPIEGIPWGTLDYWAKVSEYLRSLYAKYHEKMTGRPPDKRAYDLINISSLQSPPDWAFWGWVMSLLYAHFEATKKLVVLGYCSLSVGA